MHVQDRPLVLAGSLVLRDLVCIRQGELVLDPRQNNLVPVNQEILKIRGNRSSWSCIYFDSDTSGCTIYTHRPAECHALSCMDASSLFKVMDTPYLGRFDLVGSGSALGECIVEHEGLFPVPRAMTWAQAWKTMARGGSTQDQLRAMVRHEWSFRQIFAARVQAHDDDLWVYFGRPLWLVLLPLLPEARDWVG